MCCENAVLYRKSNVRLHSRRARYVHVLYVLLLLNVSVACWRHCRRRQVRQVRQRYRKGPQRASGTKERETQSGWSNGGWIPIPFAEFERGRVCVCDWFKLYTPKAMRGDRLVFPSRYVAKVFSLQQQQQRKRGDYNFVFWNYCNNGLECAVCFRRVAEFQCLSIRTKTSNEKTGVAQTIYGAWNIDSPENDDKDDDDEMRNTKPTSTESSVTGHFANDPFPIDEQ